MGNTPVDRQRRDRERPRSRADVVAAAHVQVRTGLSVPARRLQCEAGGPAARDRVAGGPALPERAYRFAWQEALEAWRESRPALAEGRHP